jgi:hypothetical protein
MFLIAGCTNRAAEHVPEQSFERETLANHRPPEGQPGDIGAYALWAKCEFRRYILFLLPLLGGASLYVLAPTAPAQTPVASSASPSTMGDSPTVKPPQGDPLYVRPTERMKLTAYWFDAYGPYPIAGAASIAGVNQAENTPPGVGARC